MTAYASAKEEPARQCGNTSGPVMGGINLTSYPAGVNGLQIQLSDGERNRVKWVLRESAGNSTELCAVPVPRERREKGERLRQLIEAAFAAGDCTVQIIYERGHL